MIDSDQLVFSRISGTQNTFFIATAQSGPWTKIYPQLSVSQKQILTKKLCQSFHGFKTDGLLFLHDYEGYDFAWDFFNSDGSFAEMCGNAARCASFYYHQKMKPQKHIRFFTGAGDISAEILDNNIVQVEMSSISLPKPMTVLGYSGLFLDTGVPHFVIETMPNEDLAKKLRQVNDFGSSGANITFVEKLESDSIQAVTFERGVEDYTMACGTGAVAAAMYYQSKKNSCENIVVRMPGGNLNVKNAKTGQRPLLIGPVLAEFDILIDKNFFNGKLK